MILSAKSIRLLIGLLFKRDTVKDFEERSNFIEGSSFDLMVSKLWMPNPMGTAVIGEKVRRTPDLLEIMPRDLQEPVFDDYYKRSGMSREDRKKMNLGWYLEYGSYYVLQSQEYTRMPEDLLGRLRQRRTYIVSGTPVFLTDVAPGFGGFISCGISVLYKGGLILERNARFTAYRIEQFDSDETDAYKGIYSGKMVGSEGTKRGY